MKIWVITASESLPTDEGNPRLGRSGMLCEILANRGHEVIRWASTFHHVFKRHRYDKDTDVEIGPNYTIKLLHSTGYGKNVSFQRIFDHLGLAYKFAQSSSKAPPPDVLLCSLPTIELSYMATRYGARRNIPVILDIRDLWPDIFFELFPFFIRPLGHLVLSPWSFATRRACQRASAIFAITEGFLEWGVEKSRRLMSQNDKAFTHAYKRPIFDNKTTSEAKEFWRLQGVDEGNGLFIACFFGYFGQQFEFKTVVEAASLLFRQGRTDILFILCGDGENLEELRNLGGNLPTLKFPGFISRSQIWTLMRMARVGLAPYKSSKDFMLSIPNKSIEYFSAGLPVVSSLKGALADLLMDKQCGITYQNENAQELASTVAALADGPERLNFLSRNAYSVFDNRFRADLVYGEMARHIEQTVLLHRPASTIVE